MQKTVAVVSVFDLIFITVNQLSITWKIFSGEAHHLRIFLVQNINKMSIDIWLDGENWFSQIRLSPVNCGVK